MKADKLKLIEKQSYCNDEDTVYALKDIKDTAESVEILLDEGLIVSYDNRDGWYDFAFYDWTYGTDDGDFYSLLCTVSGPADVLQECRHTYFANDGYIFYMNKKVMIAMLEFLEQYYDMD